MLNNFDRLNIGGTIAHNSSITCDVCRTIYGFHYGDICPLRDLSYPYGIITGIFSSKKINDAMPDTLRIPVIAATTTATPAKAINDHICPGCKNDRVSKSERICWKCGGTL